MTTKKQSPGSARNGGSDSKSNRDSDDDGSARVSKTADPVRSLAQRSIACDPARAHGHLEVDRPWPLKLGDYCEPCCTGCGSPDLRAGVAVFYRYAERRPAETENFDLCALCAAALWSESAEGRLLRLMLEISGFCGTLQKTKEREKIDRDLRFLEDMQHPPRGDAT